MRYKLNFNTSDWYIVHRALRDDLKRRMKKYIDETENADYARFMKMEKPSALIRLISEVNQQGNTNYTKDQVWVHTYEEFREYFTRLIKNS